MLTPTTRFPASGRAATSARAFIAQQMRLVSANLAVVHVSTIVQLFGTTHSRCLAQLTVATSPLGGQGPHGLIQEGFDNPLELRQLQPQLVSKRLPRAYAITIGTQFGAGLRTSNILPFINRATSSAGNGFWHSDSGLNQKFESGNMPNRLRATAPRQVSGSFT